MKPKFKIGDKVKVDSELLDIFGEGNIGIITDIEFRINYAKTELYKVYHIEDKEIDFYAQNIELVSTSEQLAVEKFKEELKDKINKILNEFANATDIDGRETLYKYTDCDLADLRAEILELIK